MNKAKRSICVGVALASILTAGAYANDYSSIDADSLSYEENVDYCSIIIESCKDGSDEALMKAAEAEIQRNKKIDDLGMDYEKTKFFELLDDSGEIIEAVMAFEETGNIYGVTELSVNADILNCRETAGINSKRVSTLKDGAVITFLTRDMDEEGNVWYQVSVGNTTGWCMATYLEKNVAQEQASVISSNSIASQANSQSANAQETEITEPASYSEDDLYWLAAAITKEAGSNWITDEHQLMVGNVVLNRVANDLYPDTIYDVLTQRGQYPWASKGVSVTPTERAYANAQRLLDGERVLPDNVVYQGTVSQGSGVYTSIYDSTLGTTTYFCYY